MIGTNPFGDPDEERDVEPRTQLHGGGGGGWQQSSGYHVRPLQSMSATRNLSSEGGSGNRGARPHG